MRKVLLLIDYQKGFKSDWDDIIQTMWLNSKEPDSPYIQRACSGN